MNLHHIGLKSRLSRKLAGNMSRQMSSRVSGGLAVAAFLTLLALTGLALKAKLHSGRSATSAPSHSPVLAHAPSQLDAQALLAALPIVFELNQGQADSGVQFIARGGGSVRGILGWTFLASSRFETSNFDEFSIARVYCCGRRNSAF